MKQCSDTLCTVN